MPLVDTVRVSLVLFLVPLIHILVVPLSPAAAVADTGVWRVAAQFSSPTQRAVGIVARPAASGGGTLLVGTSDGTRRDDVFVAILSDAGAVVTASTFGTAGQMDDVALAAAPAPAAGGIAVAGYFNATPGGAGDDGDAFVALFLWDGGLLRARAQGIASRGDDFAAVVEAADGTLVACGRTASYGTFIGDFDGLVSRFDGNGTLMWSVALGGAAADRLVALVQAPSDAGFVAVGTTWSFGAAARLGDIFAVRFAPAGTLTWAVVVVTATSFDYGVAVAASASGGKFLLGGHTMSTGQGGYDIVLLQVDGAGTVEWSVTVGGTVSVSNNDEYLGSVWAAADGSFWFAGSAEGFPSVLTSSVFLGRVNATGALVAAHVFDPTTVAFESAAGISASTGAGGDLLLVAGKSIVVPSDNRAIAAVLNGSTGLLPGCALFEAVAPTVAPAGLTSAAVQPNTSVVVAARPWFPTQSLLLLVAEDSCPGPPTRTATHSATATRSATDTAAHTATSTQLGAGTSATAAATTPPLTLSGTAVRTRQRTHSITGVTGAPTLSATFTGEATSSAESGGPVPLLFIIVGIAAAAVYIIVVCAIIWMLAAGGQRKRARKPKKECLEKQEERYAQQKGDA